MWYIKMTLTPYLKICTWMTFFHLFPQKMLIFKVPVSFTMKNIQQVPRIIKSNLFEYDFTYPSPSEMFSMF